MRLGELGRREEGLAAIEEAVDLYRQLTHTNPAAYLPNLATSLNNLADALTAVGCENENGHGQSASTRCRSAFRLVATHYERPPASWLYEGSYNLCMTFRTTAYEVLVDLTGQLSHPRHALQRLVDKDVDA